MKMVIRFFTCLKGEDDAMRYAMMLEDEGSPEMHVIEVEDEDNDQRPVRCTTTHTPIITPNDIVIPPNTKHDFI